MGLVTAIKQQLKKQQYYSIFIDREFSFSLSENQLIDHNVHKGDELSLGQIEAFKELTNSSKAYSKALNYLSFRPRSVHEVQKYLGESEFSEAQAAYAISELLSRGYLDDRAFAESWLRSRRALKYRSKRVLIQELAQKGVEKDLVEQVMADNPEELTDEATIAELIEKKRLLTRYPNQQKLISYLMSQGFAYGSIRIALEELNESKD